MNVVLNSLVAEVEDGVDQYDNPSRFVADLSGEMVVVVGRRELKDWGGGSITEFINADPRSFRAELPRAIQEVRKWKVESVVSTVDGWVVGISAVEWESREVA